MRTSSTLVLAFCLLATTPALAGNLSFDNGVTSWHSTQCVRPNPPASYLKAHPETKGDDMNSLMSQHNAYVDAAQAYMNCLSNEADHDQTMVNQAIAASAQKAISDTQFDIDNDAAAARKE